MKKLITIMIAVLAIAIVPANSAIWTVNTGGGADFTTIQAAIDAATTGDTIQVQSGIYDENPNVNKANLIIQGQNRANTQIRVTSASGMQVNADGVTIDGFTIKQNAAATVQKALYLGVSYYGSGITVRNTTFDGTGSTKSGSMGIMVRTNNTTIENVESFGWTGYGIDVYRPTTYVDDVSITGSTFYSNGSFDVAVDRSTNVLVQDNFMTGGPGSSIAVFETSGAPVTGTQILGNTIHGYTYDGVRLVGNDVLVNSNEIYDNLNAGVRVTTNRWPYYAANNNTVTNNDIHNNAFGVLIDHGAYPEPTLNIFNDNNIYGNTVGFDATDMSNWVDATNNWWGDATGPSGGLPDPVTANIASGLGDSVTLNVHWDPFIVPEPAMMSLLGIGALSLLRRKK